MSQICKTDGQRYVRCTCCNEYIIEGEFEAHRHSCPGRPSTHPIKELEILLNAGVHLLDSQEDGGTDNACVCLRDAAKTLNVYFAALRFDHSGRPPVELAEAERQITTRLQHAQEAKSYTIINDADGNDSFSVKAVDDADAAHKALKELGWWVAKP